MKRRILYFLLTILIMIMGLLSRKYMFIFPSVIAPFVGDMLWAMMIYFGFRLLILGDIQRNFIYSILFSFSIEISQLYQATWINNIRATTLGGLVLGHGFLYADLVSYTIGIIIGFLIDKYILKGGNILWKK